MNVLKPHLQTMILTLLEASTSQRQIERVTGIDRKTIRTYAQRIQEFKPNSSEVANYDCPQVRVMDKGDGLDQVFTWLSENKDVFLRLRGAQAVFNRETAKVFFRSIWPRWSYWTSNGGQNGPALTEVVARHVVAHVHDSLLHAGGDVAHPEESYFVPP